MLEKFDFLIVGGGIVGLAIGRQILINSPKQRVVIVEKEQSLGRHASGRNSGVIHAGFYYSPDSMKAKLTRDGNRLLKNFCKANDVPIREIGKVVVTQNETELKALAELHSRGIRNGVDLELITEESLKKLEPLASTFENALWSPTTAVADPVQVVNAVAEDFIKRGGTIRLGEKFFGFDDGEVKTSRDRYKVGHLVNAAGAYADKIAHSRSFGLNYRMMPFIGLYRYAPSLKDKFQRHIYPVPNLSNPFLGVHLTVTVNGSVKIGPTAIPILSREQYQVKQLPNFMEAMQTIAMYPKFITAGKHDVPQLIRDEMPKLSATYLATKASELIPSLDPNSFTEWGKPGIRSQLFNRKTGQLEMDYIVEGDDQSTHVLNAVSPGWTSSLSFAKHLVTEHLTLLDSNVDEQ